MKVKFKGECYVYVNCHFHISISNLTCTYKLRPLKIKVSPFVKLMQLRRAFNSITGYGPLFTLI